MSDAGQRETNRWTAATELLGRPVYSVDEGRRLGEVSGFRVRRNRPSIALVEVHLADRREALVAWSALRTVGVDIVLIDSLSRLTDQAPADETGLEAALTGRTVMTRSGQRAGRIDDYAIDTRTGQILSFRVEADGSYLHRLTGFGRDKIVEVPDAQIVSLGPDALIVDDSIQPEAAAA